MSDNQKRNKDGKYVKKPVLCFNSRKKLSAIFSSITTAAKILGVTKMGVSYACSGRIIAYYGNYFRYLYDDIEIEISDLDTLTVIEYDKLCEKPKRIYKTKKALKRNIINTVEIEQHEG